MAGHSKWSKVKRFKGDIETVRAFTIARDEMQSAVLG
jgi:hypothetical protein